MATPYGKAQTTEISETDLTTLETSLSALYGYARGTTTYTKQLLNEIKGFPQDKEGEACGKVTQQPSNRILLANQMISSTHQELIEINTLLNEIRKIVGDYGKKVGR
jgi:hypothetical protein